MGKVNFCKKSFFFMKKFRAFAILTNRSCFFLGVMIKEPHKSRVTFIMSSFC